MKSFEKSFDKIHLLMEWRKVHHPSILKCIECGAEFKGDKSSGYTIQNDPICDECALDLKPTYCLYCKSYIPESDMVIDSDGLPSNKCKKCSDANKELPNDNNIETEEGECTASVTTIDAFGPENGDHSLAAASEDSRIPIIIGKIDRRIRRKNKK